MATNAVKRFLADFCKIHQGLSKASPEQGAVPSVAGEIYVAGSGAQDGSPSLGGSKYQFSGGISSVTDTVKTTAPSM